ncbi:MAG TPA: hypothetical protein DEQ14_05185 [Treponema sp.]|nr:hypothetical protein [Treponema sp.]
MDNEQNKIPFIITFLRRFGGTFSATIITVTITGMLLARYNVNVGGAFNLFSLGGNGIAYKTILQLAASSALLAFFSVVLFGEWFFPTLRFAWRIFLYLLIVLIIASLFVIIFKWFSIDDIMAWLSFVFLTIACFAASFGLTMLKIKHERKKYGRLLAEYKARRSR